MVWGEGKKMLYWKFSVVTCMVNWKINNNKNPVLHLTSFGSQCHISNVGCFR
jgi:hypothetical protein